MAWTAEFSARACGPMGYPDVCVARLESHPLPQVLLTVDRFARAINRQLMVYGPMEGHYRISYGDAHD